MYRKEAWIYVYIQGTNENEHCTQQISVEEDTDYYPPTFDFLVELSTLSNSSK